MTTAQEERLNFRMFCSRSYLDCHDCITEAEQCEYVVSIEDYKKNLLESVKRERIATIEEIEKLLKNDYFSRYVVIQKVKEMKRGEE